MFRNQGKTWDKLLKNNMVSSEDYRRMLLGLPPEVRDCEPTPKSYLDMMKDLKQDGLRDKTNRSKYTILEKLHFDTDGEIKEWLTDDILEVKDGNAEIVKLVNEVESLKVKNSRLKESLDEMDPQYTFDPIQVKDRLEVAKRDIEFWENSNRMMQHDLDMLRHDLSDKDSKVVQLREELHDLEMKYRELKYAVPIQDYNTLSNQPLNQSTPKPEMPEMPDVNLNMAMDTYFRQVKEEDTVTLFIYTNNDDMKVAEYVIEDSISSRYSYFDDTTKVNIEYKNGNRENFTDVDFYEIYKNGAYKKTVNVN